MTSPTIKDLRAILIQAEEMGFVENGTHLSHLLSGTGKLKKHFFPHRTLEKESGQGRTSETVDFYVILVQLYSGQ